MANMVQNLLILSIQVRALYSRNNYNIFI